jgi:hypothetical protein
VRTLESSTLSARIDGFLASRGITPDTTLVVGGRQGEAAPAAQVPAPVAPAAPAPPTVELQPPSAAVDFVCEDDVRQALRSGQRIRLSARAIVTPAARDLGDAHDVLIDA